LDLGLSCPFIVCEDQVNKDNDHHNSRQQQRQTTTITTPTFFTGAKFHDEPTLPHPTKTRPVQRRAPPPHRYDPAHRPSNQIAVVFGGLQQNKPEGKKQRQGGQTPVESVLEFLDIPLAS
ncbi:unnamed protein product, partial [Ectocarpus sp. 6 AP-2014]